MPRPQEEVTVEVIVYSTDVNVHQQVVDDCELHGWGVPMEGIEVSDPLMGSGIKYTYELDFSEDK